MNLFDYFAPNWCNLSWSHWVPFTADRYAFRDITPEPGLYRIRAEGENFLMYIGETRRTLHQRLNELRHSIKRRELMPWNDPHTAAPSLWAWMDAEGFQYECSAASLDASQKVRRGMESYLLYRYRQEQGESTLCNFGRFHPRYRKSTNRKDARRGGKLEDTQKDNPSGGPSIPPLRIRGYPSDSDWMGLSWSEKHYLDSEGISTVSDEPGLYLLFDSDTEDVVYIGQSINCSNRLQDHRRKPWEGKVLMFSWYNADKPILPHQLKEMENDLIGNYFETYRGVPAYQF